MMQFAISFPEKEIVVSLIRQLSWTHLLAVLLKKLHQAIEIAQNRMLRNELEQ